jgi:hypothetical protein
LRLSSCFRERRRKVHDRSVAMDFYVGPAVLTLDDLTLGVTAFIDSSANRGLYVWGGFLDTHREELRFSAVEAMRVGLALPGRDSSDIDVVYTSQVGIGFLGTGPSPLAERQHRGS